MTKNSLEPVATKPLQQAIHLNDRLRSLMRIGIVGSGISGLSAAYFLTDDHEVEIFESADYVGGHTNTIDCELDGRSYSIDTGFIVFNDRTYPNFCRMMTELDVASQPTTMTFSVRNESSGLEYRGADLNGLFAQRKNLFRPQHWWLLKEMLRFNNQAEQRLAGEPDSLTVQEFFSAHKFSDHFLNNFFYPMASAIWSCPASGIDQFPIRFIVEFYKHHGLLSVTNRPQWRVIQGGSRQYVPKLTKSFADRIYLNSPVVGIQREPERVGLQLKSGEWKFFDQIIFACHSDQALKILGNQATPLEREVLAQFPYERNTAWLHTDSTVLPKNRNAWAAWNYYLSGEPSEKATVTYNMNILQGISSPHTFCVSLNSQQQIDRSRLIREITYHHPVFTPFRREYQQRQVELINHHRLSYCGAYWGNGFHEDGVKSAINVCRRLSESLCIAVSTRAGSGTDVLSPSVTS
jgi:predicted NAD/FAD-binding protein